MKLNLVKNTDFLAPSLVALKPEGAEIAKFKSALFEFFDSLSEDALEDNVRTHFIVLLGRIFSPNHIVEPYESVDFVIRLGGKNSKPAVLFETKRSDSSNEMIRKNDINRKAFHELILYYMRERSRGNSSIRRLVINSNRNVYIFDSSEFEKHFWNDPTFKTEFMEWSHDQKVSANNPFFFKEIAQKFLDKHEGTINATHIDLSVYGNSTDRKNGSKSMELLYKLLSPHNLLKIPVRNDSNVLNRGFYDELLHIVGLEERKCGPMNTISRPLPKNRNKGALIENVIARLGHIDAFNSKSIIEEYGTSRDTREFNIALELCLTWINRILFLKLLEAQLMRYNNGDKTFQFLNGDMVRDFSDLSDLFFLVLSVEPDSRDSSVQEKYSNVPYLNSSLFESTELEKCFSINILNNNLEIPIFGSTVLRDWNYKRRSGSISILAYILEFLDAYDFGSAENGTGSGTGNGKSLINASVLGLIFEKINGYKEGAVYTPGYITMHMSKLAIENTVLEEFIRHFAAAEEKDIDVLKQQIGDIEDLKNHIGRDFSKKNILALNKVIDSLRICDPAVGSGHFLVSCLNEIIALKSRLGILADSEGRILTDFHVEVENDELVVTNSATGYHFNYQVFNGQISPKIQFAQRTLFHEKEKLIENCLFGVDINANSVHICQLRLWIELLKHAYYKSGRPGELETLPSIDINIKCGNSLLSRFTLDVTLNSALHRAGLKAEEYRSLVESYKKSKNLQTKREIQEKISKIKSIFQEDSLKQLDQKIATEISVLEGIRNQQTFTAMEADLNGSRTKKLAEIEEKLESLKARRENLLKQKVFQSAFEWRYEFPEVLDENGNFLGFDIIITNPPYMGIKGIRKNYPEEGEYYSQKFPHTATGSYDLANLFFELALELSKPEGNNIFIFPHKIFSTDSGSCLREYLLNSRSIKQILHFGANQIFEGVTTYPCIALFNKQQAESFKFKKFGLRDNLQNQILSDTIYSEIKYHKIERAISLYGDNQWIFFSNPSEYDLFEKLYNTNFKVEDAFEDAFQGIGTSKDSLYVCRKMEENEDKYKILVNPDEKTENPPIETKEFWVEKKFFKPMLIGRDLSRFSPSKSNRLVFFPYSIDQGTETVSKSILAKEYPLTDKFVSHYSREFASREANKGAELAENYAYIYPRNLAKFEQNKLLAMEICTNHPNLTLDNNAMYHSTTVRSLVLKPEIKHDYRFYLGILNSKLFWWFLIHTGDTLRGDGRRIFKNFIFPFPIPNNVSQKEEKRIVDPVEELLKCHAKGGEQADKEVLELAIHTAVCETYGLTQAERRFIDNIW